MKWNIPTVLLVTFLAISIIAIILFLSPRKNVVIQHQSVKQLWDEYQSTLPPSEKVRTNNISSWYFSDNQNDADELAALTLSGKKQATATSLWYFEYKGEPIPQVGELYVITNWNGVAQCINYSSN